MDGSEQFCLVCRHSFSSDIDLKDHNAKEHSGKSGSKFHCSICNKDFRDSFNLKRHVDFMHSPKNEVKLTKNTRCPVCTKCYQKKDILNHFTSAHQINMEESDLTFPSLSAFEDWKVQIERETKSRYVKVRNVYTYKDGSTLNTFYCHRDGFVKNSRSKNIRRMKTFGSNKINGHCPSKMTVKCNPNQEIDVKFIKTHVGHVPELNRVYLDKKEKGEIAEKLSMNVPFDQILDDVQDSIKDSDLQRVHLLSKQDLRNIARDFKVKKRPLPSPENSIFELGVERLCADDMCCNFLRMYKPKGSFSNDFPQVKAKDFLLLIMNDMQKEMLEKYGNNFLCIDVTHGLFLHDLNMYTLYVLDEMQRAFPCAFWFANRSDIIAMELFFYCLQDILKGIIKPDLLMSNETLQDAWSAVMTPPGAFIYCMWLVDLDWRNNLRKVQSKEKQTVIYKRLRNLIEERDCEMFSRELDSILEDLDNDPETKLFGQYLDKYKRSSERWASCHRLQFANTFMDLEKLHKSLKYIYLKRDKTHGIDDIVCNMMAYLRERYLEHPIISSVDKLMDIKNRHKTAINMTQANLTKISETSWDVSDANNEEIFHVERVKENCDNCRIDCKSCCACIHLYSCSCYDSCIKWNMCQHIHLVCFVANHEHNTGVAFESFEKPLKISEDEQSTCCDSTSVTFTGHDSDSENLAIIQQISAPLCSGNIDDVELKKKEILNKFTILLDNATSLEQLDLISKQLTPCEQIFGIVYKSKFEQNC